MFLRALVSRQRERKSSFNKIAAGLNHMVARQSKISFSRGSSRPRDRTQVSHIVGRCFNLCTTREALKYKHPSTDIKDFKGGKEARLKEDGGGGGRGRVKGVALQTSPATYGCPGVMGLFPGPPEKGGLELGPTQNQTRPEPEFEFSAKRR